MDNHRGLKHEVLDHGFVRLVDYMGDDLSVVRAARVSYDAEWRAGENEKSDSRLLAYLWRNKHTSPFESVELQFEVKAPIFVFRQWHRHRTWSYNELSARYRELPEEFYVPNPTHIGAQSTDNKQMRVIGYVDDSAYEMAAIIRDSCAASFRQYHLLIKAGVPRELARGVLPMNTYSHMFAKVNMLNLFRFMALRMHKHAQYEIRVYAFALLDMCEKIAPVCAKAFKDEIEGLIVKEMTL